MHKIHSTGSVKVFETRGGLSYGAITSIDVGRGAEKIIAGTESGEILTFKLLENLHGSE